MKKLPLFSLAAMLASTSAFADTYFIKPNSGPLNLNDASSWYYTSTEIYPSTSWVEALSLNTSTNTGSVKTYSVLEFAYSEVDSFSPTIENDVAYTYSKVDGAAGSISASPYLSDGLNAHNFIIRTNRDCTFSLTSSDTGKNFQINVANTLSILYSAQFKMVIDDEDITNTYTLKAKTLSLFSGTYVDFGSANRAFDNILIEGGTVTDEGGANSTPITRFYTKQVTFGGTYSMGFKKGKGTTTTTEMYFTDLIANSETAAFNVGGEIVLDQVDDNAETTDVNEYVQDVFILDFTNAGITDESNGIYNLVYAGEGYTGFDLWDENLVYGFTIKNLNLTEGNYEFMMNDNMLQLAVGSAVPEPSTIAGITGLLALAFAAYRRRK